MKQARLCHNNVGVFVRSHLITTDSDKDHFIQEHFVPTAAYKFPQVSSRRSFQHSWLSKYQCLRYSKQDDGGYCLLCALFFRPTVNLWSDPGVLVTKPLINFWKALEILNKHEGKLNCVVQMDKFVEVMTNQQSSIWRCLNRATEEQIAVNRQKLHSIVATMFCG